MKHKKTLLTTIALAFFISGCNPNQATASKQGSTPFKKHIDEASKNYIFDSDTGEQISTRFDDDQIFVKSSLNGIGNFVGHRVVSGSGAKYTHKNLIIWTQGDYIRIEKGEKKEILFEGRIPLSILPQTEVLVFAPYQVDCQGAFPQKCFVQILGNGKKEYFYSGIKGFDFTPGYQYELLVEKTPTCKTNNSLDCPQDVGKYHYTLKKIVSKKAK